MSKKDAFYFKHDCNARNDERLKALRRKHGMEGYGIYWAIVEDLRQSADYTLTTDYEAIAWDLHVDAAKVQSIVCDFGLFEFTDDGERYYSERLREDMEKWEHTKEVRRASGLASVEAKARMRRQKEGVQPQTPTDASTSTQTDANGDIAPSTEAPKPKKRFVKPTIEEVRAYCEERKNSIDPVGFWNFYESKGWVVGKSPMKDWKACVRTWENSRNNAKTQTNGKERTGVAGADTFSFSA